MSDITVSNYEDVHEELRGQFSEFAQRKSDFQIEKFVACSDSQIPSHQYRHVLTQMRVGLTELKRRIVDQERQVRKRDRAQADGYIDADLDIVAAEIEIESLGYDIDSKLIEVNQYSNILSHLENEHGGKFTNDEYQDDEPSYWRSRIAQQLHDAVIDRQTGCGQGNLIAMREATCDTILPGSKNIIAELPTDLQLLHGISIDIPKRRKELG